MLHVKELLQKQKEFDNNILRKNGINNYPLPKVQLGLLVELGELANEVQSFKFWKENKEINRGKILEEWADCFHLALSLENQLNQVSERFLNNPYLILKLSQEDNCSVDKHFLMAYKSVLEQEVVLLSILKLGLNIGITLEEMEAAYLEKHKENIRRQQERY